LIHALPKRKLAKFRGPGKIMRVKALISLFAGMLMAGSLAAAQAPKVVGPPPPLDPENTLVLDLSNGGRVAIQLRPDVAPGHVERMKTLARKGFYNGLIFHRVIDGFMAQGGDPKGSGEGGSQLPDLKAEFTPDMPFLRGTVAAARTGDNVDSANSQFFIMFAPVSSIQGEYTVWGRVTKGMDAVDKIAPGEPPAEPSKIVTARLGG
jgi:peptidylprolyl isomerase